MVRRMLMGVAVAAAVGGSATAAPPREGREPAPGGPAAAWVVLHAAHAAVADALTMPLGTVRLSDM